MDEYERYEEKLKAAYEVRIFKKNFKIMPADLTQFRVSF